MLNETPVASDLNYIIQCSTCLMYAQCKICGKKYLEILQLTEYQIWQFWADVLLKYCTNIS